MLSVLVQKIAIVLLVHQSVAQGKDLLHLFRPKPDLPQELNDFLTDVQHHRKDFAFIRNAAKNRRKYENSYQEHKKLFAEDIDNQVTANADYYKKENEFKDWMPHVRQNIYADEGDGGVPSAFDRSRSIRSYYPEGRYSKFIHSPVRLRRELEENYLNQQVKLNPNSDYGNINRAEPKYPDNKFIESENKYHTGYIVGLDDGVDYDDEDYYADLRPSEKKRREVEISIKSDGKLVKHIEESDNGPKSIVLNIKSENSNSKVSENLALVSSAVASSVATTIKYLNEQPTQNKDVLNNGPGNSKTIPSLTNSNPNQNTFQNQNVGVPINSIPAISNGFINSKNTVESSSSVVKEDSKKSSGSQDKKPSFGNYNLPEIGKVSNTAGFKAKSLNNYYKPDYGYGDFKWSGDSNHMAKSIDMAQNNINNFDSVGEKQPSFDLESSDNKKDEFEKVQGFIMGSTIANNDKLNDKYMKRQSDQRKRRNEADKFLEAAKNGRRNIDENGMDYVGSLERAAYEEQKVPSPKSSHWETGDSQIHLDPNQTYEVIEKATRDILVIPMLATTCMTNPQDEADVVGQLVADELKADAEAAEATTECGHGEEEAIEMDQHQEEEGHDECETTTQGNVQEIEIIHENPKHEAKSRRVRKRHVDKRSNKNKSKKIIIIKEDKKKKPHKHRGRYQDKLHHFKREQGNKELMDKDAFRHRKHLPALPKYKRKRVRQHPKKRIDRDLDDVSDFYDLNEFYDDSDDEFNSISAYRGRQLKTVDYEFDPTIIKDVGDHEKEEIEKFKKSMGESKADDDREDAKVSGLRKKFKSEGDYVDEEEPFTAGPSLKPAVKKTQNQFAAAPGATTEANDDDYDYADLNDMEDEDEDIAYEEEQTRDDSLDVDEAAGNFNKNEHENDRLNLNNQKELVELSKVEELERSTPQNVESTNVPNYSMEAIEDMLLEANEVLAGAHAHGRGGAKKKRKKKPPRREIKSQRLQKRKAPKATTRKNSRKKKQNSMQDKTKPGWAQNDLNAEMVSNFHGRDHALKGLRGKKKKPKRQSDNNQLFNGKVAGALNSPEKIPGQFQKAPVSDRQKEDIFLRYNPEFQRWPRFVQNDNKYHEIIRRRAMENQRRYLRKARAQNNFPISNEYFLNPRAPFVKRQEPSSAAPASEAAAAPPASEAASEAAPSAAPEASSEAAPASGAAETTKAAGESAAPAAEESASAAAGEAAASEAAPAAEPSQAASESAELAGGVTETLPQAAQNILQTANSDIFDNTSAIGMNGVGGANSMAPGAGGPAEASTPFQFTTNAEDLTANTQCDTTQKNEVTPCQEESASHSPVTITSVLPLIPESVTKTSANLTKDEFLDLNEILDGVLPKHVVAESLSNAKGGVRQGLRGKKFNMNLMMSSYNNSAETGLILNEMTNLMTKLKYHSTCQLLSPNLMTYIKVLTRNEMDDPMRKLKEMNDIDFDEHQSNYMFHQDKGESVQEKGQVLKELLNKYNNLPDNCKERAEPVKEYIETHLAMIDKMSGNAKATSAAASAAPAATPAAAASSSVIPKAKKEIKMADKNLDGQVMEEGLKNQHPNANEVIDDDEKKNKREALDARVRFGQISTSTSPEYGRLADAVRNLRNRRQIIKRISEIYGRGNREEVESSEKRNVPSKTEESGFESPRVINF